MNFILTYFCCFVYVFGYGIATASTNTNNSGNAPVLKDNGKTKSVCACLYVEGRDAFFFMLDISL